MRTRRAAKLEAANGRSACEEGEVLEEREAPQLPEVLTLSKNPSTSGGCEDHVVTLCSSLDPGPQGELYFSCDPEEVVEDSVLPPHTHRPRGQGSAAIIQDCIITSDFEQRECAPPIKTSRKNQKKLAKLQGAGSTGSKWFDMKAPHLTPQLKNDLKLLRMRNALDPSRHYKANDSKKTPRYFQVGTVVADSADFYSGRIPRRQRKQTLVDELLANQDYHRKKYLELQEKFKSGTSRHQRINFKRKFKKA